MTILAYMSILNEIAGTVPHPPAPFKILQTFWNLNFESVGKRAAKLLAVKVGVFKKKSPFQPKCAQVHSAWVRANTGSNHTQSLTGSNFDALWPTDPKFFSI